MNTTEALKNVLLRFGAGWVLWLLGGLLLASLGLIVERFLYYRAGRCNVKAMALALDEMLAAHEYEKAIETLGKARAVATSIAAAGLRLAARGPAAAEKAMIAVSSWGRQTLTGARRFTMMRTWKTIGLLYAAMRRRFRRSMMDARE